MVNTIESEKIKTPLNEEFFKLYNNLDSIFDLQYGKILIASLPKDKLQHMMDNNSPFVANYVDQLDRCLNGSKCQEVRDLVDTLGKLYQTAFNNN